MESRNIMSLEELKGFAEEILGTCSKSGTAVVLGLSGELGAGKTAFVKELGKALGVQGEITSPTFTIMKSYYVPQHQLFKTLTHIDAYRIESDDEMRVLKFDEIIQDPERLICIEWPEIIEALIPEQAHRMHFEIVKDDERRITYGN